MKLAQLFKDNDAVSPVIGVILMVSITVILAAVIGTFVLGLGDQVKSSAPSASLEYDFTNNASNVGYNVSITHTGGDELSNDSIEIKGSDSGGFESEAYGSSTYTAGDEIFNSVRAYAAREVTTGGTEFSLNSGETIRVIWSSDDGSKTNVISSSEVPSS